MSNIKNINLHIHSLIDDFDATGLSQTAPEVNESDHNAVLRFLKGEAALSYEEKSEGGKIFCDILVKEGRVTVSRSGAIKSVILFEEGKTYTGIYEIPPYKFDMTVKTKRLKFTTQETGGIIDILYNMNIGGAEKRCRMKITFGENP